MGGESWIIGVLQGGWGPDLNQSSRGKYQESRGDDGDKVGGHILTERTPMRVTLHFWHETLNTFAIIIILVLPHFIKVLKAI